MKNIEFTATLGRFVTFVTVWWLGIDDNIAIVKGIYYFLLLVGGFVPV